MRSFSSFFTSNLKGGRSELTDRHSTNANNQPAQAPYTEIPGLQPRQQPPENSHGNSQANSSVYLPSRDRIQTLVQSSLGFDEQFAQDPFVSSDNISVLRDQTSASTSKPPWQQPFSSSGIQPSQRPRTSLPPGKLDTKSHLRRSLCQCDQCYPIRPQTSLGADRRPFFNSTKSINLETSATQIALPDIYDPKGRKVDIVVESNAKNRDVTLQGLNRHLKSGKFICPKILEFGDVVYMCTFLDSLGVSLRPHMFWQMVTIEGKECPLFLVCLSNNVKGPEPTEHVWFEEVMGWSLNHEILKDGTYISPVQCVYLKMPNHQQIFVTLCNSNQVSKNDLKDIKYWLNGFINLYETLLTKLCSHIHKGFADRVSDRTNYFSTQWLRSRIPEWRSKAKVPEQDLYTQIHVSADYGPKCWEGGSNKITSSLAEKEGTDKIIPPRDTCVQLTGNATYFHQVSNLSTLPLEKGEEMDIYRWRDLHAQRRHRVLA